MMSHRRSILSIGKRIRLPVLLQQPARTKATTYYSKTTGVSRDWLAKLQQPVDLTFKGIGNWLQKKKLEEIRNDQKYVPERQATLGPDLALAHFIVARGGAVQFKGSERWVEKDKEGKYYLPNTKLPDLHVEAVDCSNMDIMYDSFDNFADLQDLKYLKLSGCKYLDDWCMDRMVMFQHSLVHLDLTGCPNVSERGLTAIHKLSNLRVLEIGNMSSVQHQALVALMIEEVLPECHVQGVDVHDISAVTEIQSPTPAFIRNILEENKNVGEGSDSQSGLLLKGQDDVNVESSNSIKSLSADGHMENQNISSQRSS